MWTILMWPYDTAEACKQNFTSRHFVIKTKAHEVVSRQRSRQTQMTLNIFEWSSLWVLLGSLVLGRCSDLLLDINSRHVLHHRRQASHDRQHLQNHMSKSACSPGSPQDSCSNLVWVGSIEKGNLIPWELLNQSSESYTLKCVFASNTVQNLFSSIQTHLLGEFARPNRSVSGADHRDLVRLGEGSAHFSCHSRKNLEFQD